MRRGKKPNFHQHKKEPRINERIRAPQIRIINEGEEPQVVTRNVALKMATDLGLDLVEISPNQEPPVCKIINYGKFKFEQKKRKREQARGQRNFTIKEVKMGPKIAVHDYDLKKRNANSFLLNGDKVKVTVRFRGREITHPEIGMGLMERMKQDLKEIGVVEAPARLQGRYISMVLAPNKKQVKSIKKEVAQEAVLDKVTPGSSAKLSTKQDSEETKLD